MSEPPPRAAQGTPSHQQQNTAAVRSTGVKEHNLNFTEQANRHEIGSWDQFEANKKLIQDASTYDDLMYTTPIPQHIPLNWQKKMEHKAQSIEKNPTSDHGRHNTKDEETAFASVRRNEILRRSQTGESSLKIKIRKETRLKKTPKKVKVILRSSDLTKANLGQADMSHDEGSESSSASGSDISEDDRVAEVAEETMKAPDQILKIINDWGKGTTCELHWKFRHSSEIYQSIGEVVTRHSRKGAIRVKISYTPQHQPGPSGFLYLPASHKINIFRLRVVKLNRIVTQTPFLDIEETQDCDTGCDLEPLPPLAHIDPTFAAHVIAIFRSILRGYPTLKLITEKTSVWHKFLNAPRDSLTTVRQAIQRKYHVPNKLRNEEPAFSSPDEKLEREVDRRSIRSALRTARAGNLSKATRILDNVYFDSNLSVEEKVAELKSLHPDGERPQAQTDADPRTGIIEKHELRAAIEKLAPGASPGPTGLSEAMLRLLADDEESSTALCHMLRDVVNGEIASSVRDRLTRCRLMAINKPQNGIRPIAIGETLLKVCGSILLNRNEEKLKKFFQPVQRGILQKNACEGIVHELLDEYDKGHAILAIDYKNAYNTPTRQAIFEALKKDGIFKPFMRIFNLEYGDSSDLLFFANNSLHSIVKSTSGVRQGSALSSLYFCALIQDSLKEIEESFPDVTVRAYMDDITLSSTNPLSLQTAFLHLHESSRLLGLEMNFQKCEWFKKTDTPWTPQTLQAMGVACPQETVKILGAYIGQDEMVSECLKKKMDKHKCLFRRLRLMGPSNLSLAILNRCAIPRQDYHLRVHKPEASLEIAQQFDAEVGSIIQHWFNATGPTAKLATLPQYLGGLGLTPSCLKQKHFFQASRKAIEEQSKTNNAPVVIAGSKRNRALNERDSQKNDTSKRLVMKAIRSEQKRFATELRKDMRLKELMERGSASFHHLQSTSNYINPYLFRFCIMMRLGIVPENMPKSVVCPGCLTEYSSDTIFQHIPGCTQCCGINATKKHTRLVRFLGELCAKAGVPHVIEPRVHSSFFCTKCKATISEELSEHHPCRARRMRSGPDLGIMWSHLGEILYDVTVVHSCAPSYAKTSVEQLIQNALERKHKKYVVQGGIPKESFSCLAMTELGQLHNNTKTLIVSLAQRSQQNVKDVKEAFQLEIEKMNAYTIATQLRQYFPPIQWLGGLEH